MTVEKPQRDRSQDFDSQGLPQKGKQSRKKSHGTRIKSQQRPPKAPKDIRKDPKYQEIAKLVKNMVPLTINGTPTSVIKHRMNQVEHETNPLSPQSEDAHGKESDAKTDQKTKKDEFLLCDIIAKILEKSPTDPLYLSFLLKPSDPDFPYDLQTLQISMLIPSGYPRKKNQVPSIVVLNDNIPKGFAINVEAGFRNIAETSLGLQEGNIELVGGRSLVSQVRTLDHYLETFLSQQERPTLKFVKNKSKKSTEKTGNVGTKNKPEKKREKKDVKEMKGSNVPGIVKPSREELDHRNKLIKEVIDKGISMKLFRKNSQESIYKVELPIFKADFGLVAKQLSILLRIPIDYPKSNSTMSFTDNFKQIIAMNTELVNQNLEAKQIEKNMTTNFMNYDFGTSSLLQKLNFFVNNMYAFSLEQNSFLKRISEGKRIELTN